MKKKILRSGLLLVVLLLLLVYVIKRPSMVSPQPMPAALASMQAPDPKLLQQHVRFLSEQTNRTHDQPEGMAAASAYIQQQLVAMGLSPTEQAFVVDDQKHHNIVVRVLSLIHI